MKPIGPNPDEIREALAKSLEAAERARNAVESAKVLKQRARQLLDLGPEGQETWVIGVAVADCRHTLLELGWRVDEIATPDSYKLIGRHGEATFVIFGRARLAVWQNALASAAKRTQKRGSEISLD